VGVIFIKKNYFYWPNIESLENILLLFALLASIFC
jgi:hypothetical protein